LKGTVKPHGFLDCLLCFLIILCLRASDADGNGGLIATATAPTADCQRLQRPRVLAAVALLVRVVMVTGGRLMGRRGVAAVGGGQEAGSAVQGVDIAVLHTAVGFRHHKLE
jgi:hypothetical protein